MPLSRNARPKTKRCRKWCSPSSGRQAPKHVGYALFRDGLEFVHLFVNLKDDDSSPVTELPTFKTYVREIVERCVHPPVSTRLTLQVLDSYGFPCASMEAPASSAAAA